MSFLCSTFFFFASKSCILTPGNIHFKGINHTAVWIIFLAIIQLINHMKKPYVVMSYHHHRHTSKTTVYGKPIPWGRENKSSQTIMWLKCINVYSTHTRHSKSTKHCTQNQESQFFLRHSRHCGLCTSINKPHQTFRETNKSYGLDTSTHSTALNCSALPKPF